MDFVNGWNGWKTRDVFHYFNVLVLIILSKTQQHAQNDSKVYWITKNVLCKNLTDFPVLTFLEYNIKKMETFLLRVLIKMSFLRNFETVYSGNEVNEE